MKAGSKIKQNFSIDYRYEVIFTRDIFGKNNSILKKIIADSGIRHVVVIADSGFAEANPSAIADMERALVDWKGSVHLVQGGEVVKNTLDDLEKVLRLVNDLHIDRHSLVIGIGGGAVLDMVGFAAAIAHRGVRHIRIPTTVLSQNDSGVGVKNGVNYFGKKNFIGTFAPPLAVINDVQFLKTLEMRDLRSGVAEAIKVALLKDEEFFTWMENNEQHLLKDTDAMEALVFRCAELHVQHIAGYGDPFESGSSRPLDFGHWSAHKLEHLTNYSLRHGEAVAIGMALDICYSAAIGVLSVDSRDRILRLMINLGFDIWHPLLGTGNKLNQEIIIGLEEFREHLGGELTITLIENIGKATDVHEISVEKYNEALLHLTTLQKNADQ